MLIFVRKTIAFFICLFGVLLPFRARIIFSETLGWFVQVFYMGYVYTIRFIIKELKKNG
ncbi:MAG: hypothetical protein KA059_03060 [Elusimicrobiales bacterium]|nr:hypothetical protein [Elusimicrobiales bacterium]